MKGERKNKMEKKQDAFAWTANIRAEVLTQHPAPEIKNI